MSESRKGILRKVIAVKHGGTSLSGKDRWVQTLSCGHKDTILGSKPTSVRRMCFHLDCKPKDGEQP